MLLSLIPYLFSFAAMVLTAYFAFRKEGQEEDQALIIRINKIEVEQANQLVRNQGFQAEIESVADFGKRERSAILETTVRDYNTIRELIKDVPTMRELVYRMVERLENMKESTAKLETKMDRILDILTQSK